MVTGNLDRKIISLLISLGLSEREARVYSILLTKGENSAKNIANFSGIPQGHVYSLLKPMHSKGLVEILEGEIKKYRGISLELAIDKLIGEKERALVSLKNEGCQIAQLIKVNEKGIPSGEFEPIFGRNKIEKKALEMVQSAKKDVLCIASLSSLFATLSDEKGYLSAWRNLLSRGIKPRILTPFGGKKTKHLKPLIDAGMDIRFLDIKDLVQMDFMGMLIIDEEALFGSRRSQDNPLDFRIWTNHRETIAGARQKFEELWNKAMITKPYI